MEQAIIMRLATVADGIVLRMWLAADRSDALAARRRRFVGPAGCGMCGLESLAEANRGIPMASCDLRVSRQDIAEAVEQLNK
jgi:FdhD protein